jgi:hypothetical protein
MSEDKFEDSKELKRSIDDGEMIKWLKEKGQDNNPYYTRN